MVAYYSESGRAAVGQDKELWLLAHFVALLQAKPGESLHSVNLKALYVQLSALSSQIRIGFPSLGGVVDIESKNSLPRYVHDRLTSLVSQEGVSDLLDRFTL